jgi:hypothetical protein
MADSDDIPTLYLFDTLEATIKLDRVAAAVDLAHQVLREEHGTNGKLASAWLTLELVQEKLSEMRVELEDAPRAWTDSDLAKMLPKLRNELKPRLTRKFLADPTEVAHG